MVAAPEVGAEMPVISKERWEEMRRMAYVKPSGYAKRGANAFLRIRVVPFPHPSRLRGACVDLSGRGRNERESRPIVRCGLTNAPSG